MFYYSNINAVAYPVRIIYDNPWMVSVMMVIVIRVVMVVMAGPSNHERNEQKREQHFEY